MVQMFLLINILNFPDSFCICFQAHMYEINYIDRQYKQSQDKSSCSGQLVVGMHPLDCKYTILSFPIALTTCMGREGRGECCKGGCESKTG